MQILSLKTKAALEAARKRLAKPPVFAKDQEASVFRILDSVRKNGDAALMDHAFRLDGTRLSPKTLRVPATDLAQCLRKMEPALKTSLKRAIGQIRSYQAALMPKTWERRFRDGVVLGQRVTPLKRVGLCVPGGASPLVSSVLMAAVPALVAGVDELVLVTPNRQGKGIAPALLGAAALCGIQEVYQVGGAHAVAALAFGTESIPRVDKIVGPGSSWVATAQRLCFGVVGIDMVAGPSEIMVIADKHADPQWVAADLLSQAEHAGEESAVLVTDSMPIALAVVAALKVQSSALSRKNAISQSLDRFGLAFVVDNLEGAAVLADAMAPEHLELMVKEPRLLMKRIRNFGACFLGASTPEPVGDYFGGPSHVLPTSGSARFASALSVDSFLKKSSVLEYSPKALKREGADIRRLALAEGLTAHAASVAIRGC
jgi:histidinol dehydrogenase